MRTQYLLSAGFFRTLGLLVLFGTVLSDTAWSQGGNRNRDRRNGRSNDPTSLVSTYESDAVGPKLKLSDEQKKQLDGMRRSSFGMGRGMTDEEFAKARKDVEEKAVNLLTDDQKQSWHIIKAEIQTEVTKNEVARSAVPAVTSGVVRAENTQPVVRGVMPDEKPPEGTRAVVSFGPVADERVLQNKADDEARQKEIEQDGHKKDGESSNGKNANEEPVLSFEFRYAPWADVL